MDINEQTIKIVNEIYVSKYGREMLELNILNIYKRFRILLIAKGQLGESNIALDAAINYWYKVDLAKKNEEFIKIITEFDKRKIKVISLKGILLFNDIYENGIGRHFDDFDFFYKRNHIRKVLQILDELGYLCLINDKEVKPKNISIPLNKDYYHLGFYKKEKGKQFAIEMHQNLFARELGINIKFRRLWRKTSIATLNKGRTRKLCLEHRIVYITLNMAKDYKYMLLSRMSSGCDEYINLQQIYEITTLITKNKHQIDWDLVFNFILKNKLSIQTFFVFNLVNAIYGDIIPADFLDDISKETKKERNVIFGILLDVLKAELTDIFFFNILDIAKTNLHQLYLCNSKFIKSNDEKYRELKNRHRDIEIRTKEMPCTTRFTYIRKVFINVHVRNGAIWFSFKIGKKEERRKAISFKLFFACNIEFKKDKIINTLEVSYCNNDVKVIEYDFVTERIITKEMFYINIIEQAKEDNYYIGIPINYFNNIAINELELLFNCSVSYGGISYFLNGKDVDLIHNGVKVLFANVNHETYNVNLI